MKKLISLFEENFKPCGENPTVGLCKKFIIDNGYSEKDINTLVTDGKIERDGHGYKMTSEYKKVFVGSSYKYIPEYAR